MDHWSRQQAGAMEGREETLILIDGGVLRTRGRKRKRKKEDEDEVTLKVRGV